MIAQTVRKPWGKEIIYAHDKRYMGKILVIDKGHRLSLQYHKAKHETVYTLKGRPVIQIGRRRVTARPGSVFVIPPKTVHRFEARSGRVTLLEVSTPRNADIVRLEDDYGRVKSKETR
jgi:mannose-6-phosphate isomerase-like protein (cupin superfamily)